ncbi:Hsp70 family protein [Clostridium rectalis]|uniref:Hsp70 family protein n=1 Tax=Clostridium rectalis TaxID=2040295 RepID=UPI000F63AE22|nr:Hsp70 family protein [Clostridium rectalis]
MIIGIDLGTTNSAAAYIDKDGNPQMFLNREGDRITPSVILFEDNTPVIGSIAKMNSISDPYNVVQFVKRQLGNENYKFTREDGEEFTTEELSALIIKRIKEDVENYLGKKVGQAVITVPAYFDDAQRKATQDAGAIAGLDVVSIINEPTAAALAYGITSKAGAQNVVVYDLGGGTFDVTIMKITEGEIVIKATGGDKNLGGFDFDNKIIEYVINKFEEEHQVDLYDDDIAIQDLREKAEMCKKMLSSRLKSSITVVSQGKALKVDITRDLFNEMIEPLLDRTIFIMNNVIDESGISDKIDKILLVGGSTRVNRVSEVIEKTIGIKPSSEVNPDEVVAIGAAYQGYIFNKDLKNDDKKINHKITDVNSHSLGIVAINNLGEDENCIILEKNTPLPAEAEREFYTSFDGQDQIKLKITEGEDEELEYVNIIGTATLKLRNSPKGSPINVIISYDSNSIVHVRVIDLISNEDLGEMYIERKSNLSKDEVLYKTEKISEINVD